MAVWWAIRNGGPGMRASTTGKPVLRREVRDRLIVCERGRSTQIEGLADRRRFLQHEQETLHDVADVDAVEFVWPAVGFAGQDQRLVVMQLAL